MCIDFVRNIIELGLKEEMADNSLNKITWEMEKCWKP